MAPRLSSDRKKSSRLTALGWILRILLGAAALPFLWAWLLVRLWVPLGTELPAGQLVLIALGAALVLVVLLVVLRGGERLLLPWGLNWKSFLPLVPGFLLGFYFDISLFMLPDALPPDLTGAELPVDLAGLDLALFCHIGSGLVFAAIILALFRAGRELKGVGRADWKQLLVIFLCLNAVTLYYTLTSRTVYVWDNAGYWTIARTLAEGELGYEQLMEVLRTTLTLDYNYLLAWPISLVMRLFGPSRTVFVFAITELYVFPALWGLTALANSRKWSGLVLVGLFPMLGYTGLVGFVDVAACGLGIWAYVVYTSDRPAVSRGIFSGALLVGTFLLRRYFLFFAASFGVAALVRKVLFERKQWWDFLSLFLSCALCALSGTYTFLLDKVLGSDYGDLYSAYALGVEKDLYLFCRYFGLVIMAFILSAALISFVRKKDRPDLVMGLVQFIVCFAAFLSIQSHGQQHLLMYVPPMAMLAIAALSVAPQFLSAILAMVTAAYCFVPKVQPALMSELTVPALFPSFQFNGPRRSDVDQLIALADFIDSLSDEEQVSAVILAASFTLNTETITNLRPSLGLPEPEHTTRIQYHSTVDKRDPFNWNTPAAEYLVVGDPVQVHLGEENQQVVTLLAHHVLDGTGPGEVYEALPETFQLRGGVTVRIYHREAPWRLEDYQLISETLIAAYPEYEELYKYPDWIQ